MKQHDQRCTPRSQDWQDLWAAITEVGHELKNIVVEEWRRLTGKCPKRDEHEGGV